MTYSILSKHLSVKPTFLSQNLKTEKLRRNFQLEGGDEFLDEEQLKAQMAMEAKCAAGQCKAMPSKQLVKIKVRMKLKTRNKLYNAVIIISV